MTTLTWLWPDQVISKGRSRDIREAHNALVNNFADLLAAASDALESLRRLPDAPDAYRVTCIAQLESAIAKATGKCCGECDDSCRPEFCCHMQGGEA